MSRKNFTIIILLAILSTTKTYAIAADDSFVKPLEVSLNSMASELTKKLAFDRSKLPVIDVVKQTIADNSGKKLTTNQLQNAIDLAAKKGNCVVFFPKGEYLTEQLILKSGVHIVMAKGAKIIAAVAEPNIGTSRRVKAFLYGENIENISITGQGIMDFNGGESVYKSAGNDNPHRPLGIRIVKSKDIYIEGIFMENSPQWMQHYLDCENVMIENIEVSNSANHNNDGIDIDGCRNVYIRNCKIDSDDDGICLKSKGYVVCENVLVENCVVASHCNALKLGTESGGGFKNIIYRNCKAIQSPASNDNINGVATTRTAITLIITDGGIMENIYFTDIDARECITPIFITLGSRSRKYDDKVGTPDIGAISNIKISNFNATSAGPISSMATGLSEKNMIHNLTLENINIELKYASNTDEGNVDMNAIMSKAKPGYPSPHLWKTNMPSSGFYFRYIEGLTIKNMIINNQCNDPRKMIIIDDSNSTIGCQFAVPHP